jgi:hypothetical protein
LKCNLQLQTELFYKPSNKAKAATTASGKITGTLLKKKKKSFQMVFIIKECSVVAGDSFLSEFKNKTEIYNVINNVQLFQNAICVYVQ